MTWRDPVLREVAYAGLPYQRRRDLHRAVYEAIESAPSDESLARRIALALHADRGHMPQEAWDMLRKTGEEAAWSGSSVEAVDLLERAVRWADDLSTVPDSALVDTLRTLAQAADLAGRFETGLAAADRAVSLGRDADELVRLHALRSRLHVQLGQVDQARAALEPARELAADRPPDVQASVLVAEAAATFRADQFDEAFALVQMVADLGRDNVGPKDWVQAMIIGDAIVGAGTERPWEVGRGLPVAELLGDDRGMAMCHNNLGIVAYRRGNWERALAEWELAHDAHARGGSLVDVATSLVNVAEVRGDQGNWAAALERMESARQTWVAGDYRIGILFVTSLIGRTYARLGNTFQAAAELDAAERGFLEASATSMAAETLVRRAEASWLAGKPRAAIEQLARASDIPPDARPLALLIRGCAMMTIGDATAELMLEEAIEAATAANRWYEQVAGRAQLARARGDEPTNDPDVMDLAERLGIWRLAVPGGELRLSPPPGDGQSVESVS